MWTRELCRCLSSEIRVLVDLQSDASGIGTYSYWLTMRVGLQRTGPSFTKRAQCKENATASSQDSLETL